MLLKACACRRVRDLQIDYTALSLVAPEKNRFRIKLEGRDRDWQDVGTRRQAFYTDLGPGTHRFRVAASNNSGVWNEAGTTLESRSPGVLPDALVPGAHGRQRVCRAVDGLSAPRPSSRSRA